MTLSSPLNTQQLELESIITLESPSQQKQSQETIGRKCTKCGQSEPNVKFTGRPNTWGKTYYRPDCNECYHARQRGRANAHEKKFGSRALFSKHRPPEGTPCACCKVPMTHDRGIAGMCFDHDPVTETFRGYICKKCNTSIGGLGDNLEGLMKAVKYLTTT